MPYSCIIVEDQPHVAQYLAQYLIQTGRYMVMGMANNVAAAEALLGAMQPDLLLLDVYLPDGNGLELMKTHQDKLQKTEVFLLTAAKEVQVLEQAMKLGVSDFLVKPILQSRLEQALQNFENRHKQLSGASELTQTVVDQFFSRQSDGKAQRLPKGVDGLTLQKIQQVFTAAPKDSLSAQQVGDTVGVSRSTARRYLEYLLETEELIAEQVYGNVGRPERCYRLR
ncbi:response regulator [Alteromonas sp. 1_MG-2023]|uniref:response regulator n=1 Tax=Alteromonas sp. 1_MG-2023 TaxID=3062669 RepID=UPI0026E40816|nr:response regulator [Alteromonas sp. 1_MG-2023]MDO6476717.1 response regulator [Alteromonas sp. 1_MG-2023]